MSEPSVARKRPLLRTKIILCVVGGILLVLAAELGREVLNQWKTNRFVKDPTTFPAVTRIRILETSYDISDIDSIKSLNDALAKDDPAEALSGGAGCDAEFSFADGSRVRATLIVHNETQITLNNNDEANFRERNLDFADRQTPLRTALRSLKGP